MNLNYKKLTKAKENCNTIKLGPTCELTFLSKGFKKKASIELVVKSKLPVM